MKLHQEQWENRDGYYLPSETLQYVIELLTDSIEHNDEILIDLLGYDEGKVITFRSNGII